MKATKWFLGAAAALLVMPAAAFAADNLGYGPGVDVNANGGIMTYPGAGAAVFKPGGQYGAAVGFNGWGPMGLELGYQGAAYGVQRGTGGNVVQNGGQALLKLGADINGISPYAVGGYNLTRLNASNEAQLNGINDDTFSMIPVGAGVDFNVPVSNNNAMTIGARGTYDFVFDNDSFAHRDASADDQIGAQLSIGGNF